MGPGNGGWQPDEERPTGVVALPCGHTGRPEAQFCTTCGRPTDAPLEFGPPPRPPRPPGPVAPVSGTAGSLLWPVLIAVVVILAGGGTAAVLTLHPFGLDSPAATGPPAGGQNTGTPRPAAATSHPAGQSTGASTEQRAADALASLLGRSVSDRGAVVQAVSDVDSCGPNLGQDAQTFQTAASSRQGLLSQLASLPGAGSLPMGMVKDLTSAWQASVQADQDFAAWAQDMVSNGCTAGDHSDPNYQAAIGPDNLATTNKKSFTGSWDPIAAEFGLTAYQWNQL